MSVFGLRFLLLKLLLDLGHGWRGARIGSRRVPFERPCVLFQCVRELDKSLDVVELDQPFGKSAGLSSLLSLLASLLQTRIVGHTA
jgi:hypothetical protein